MSAFVWRILPPAAIIFGIAVTATCISLLGYGLITFVVAFSRVGLRASERRPGARAPLIALTAHGWRRCSGRAPSFCASPREGVNDRPAVFSSK
jgi:hypothetical protein